jgi:hypothetical protein
MTTYELWNLIITGLGFAGTVLAVLVAYGQLKRMAQSVDIAVKANAISTVNTVLSIEQMIFENRVRLSEASIAVSEMNARADRGDHIVPADVEIATLRFNEARESYLNAFDRLCACLLRGSIPEDDYRKDYRGGLTELVQQHRELLGVDTRFRNIIKLYDKWADQ